MYITREKITKTLLLATITLLCFGIVAVILMGINQFKFGSQLASINQVSNLSHLLVRQQANIFSFLLVKNAKTDELVDSLDSFTKEDFIIDANIYSPKGVLLAQSQNAKELKTLLAEQTKKTQQIVEPIFSQQTLVGFLRVTFDAEYGQTTKARVEQQFKQLYGEIIILLLTGILLASSVHYYFRRKIHHIHIAPKPILGEMKTQTQRFHSRRRWNKRK
ncbi:hemolysin regulation protein AhpA [Mannheimia varigena]|uniref:AphA-like protein/membrane protein affecting hemolysin expression n=1 Tax=Mannheimia varigena USDA-ARS-USMARC-1296 TaxID=1433287 RepID=W0QCD7_9PAST|nr:YtjB family periplasmic protein [Mannheimia varigena]AHG76181.1 AphA-like protein/membrane protein affecting hemolysin expression [Mannheimia varigena USDA-ARS-USMARC-1296]AHG79066.1 AphA-like protein/membrane protein affecting hemolysin expression [Mannheimia varigena USDA-ARS-USMARC-1388]AWW35219.1 hemolysin regulation protein AhpA [Mannheimia varigena]TLU75633.1 hemolysin regulation protein AhpA [Mannheimia varigena]